MKKAWLLVVLLSAPLLADNSALQIIGEEFCYDIIDSYSPGSNHVMACLESVSKLVSSGMSNQESLIRAICQQAPSFPYSMGGCTEQECLDAAQDYF